MPTIEPAPRARRASTRASNIASSPTCSIPSTTPTSPITTTRMCLPFRGLSTGGRNPRTDQVSSTAPAPPRRREGATSEGGAPWESRPHSTPSWLRRRSSTPCASPTTWPSRPGAIPASAPSGCSHRRSAATTNWLRSPRPMPSPRCSTARPAECSSASSSDERAFLREHAAWALGSGLPRADGMGALLGMVVDGGFTGMLAQRTLERWSGATAEQLVVGVEGALLGVAAPEARARLVETLGLVRHSIATAPLLRLVDGCHRGRRRADRRDVGDRPAPTGRTGGRPARGGGGRRRPPRRRRPTRPRRPGPPRGGPEPARAEGLTIAQLFLHADIDPLLSSAGSGDNGGIATLLVRLGDALVRDGTDRDVQRVITLSRGSVLEATADLRRHPRRRARTRLRPHPAAPRSRCHRLAAWPLRVVTRRGIRRILRAAGRVDLLHLRMADVGSLAAADVARELGIPVVFTVAPDPHAVIESLDRSGSLTREAFGRIDLAEHFWFRTRLVQSLAANAAHTVLFPRPRLEDDMRRLVGIDLTAHAERHTIVPEGVDLATIDRAIAEASAHAQGGEPGAALRELRDLVGSLPSERRDLPLIVSVGRLHRVKGMATLVEAWAREPLAAARQPARHRRGRRPALPRRARAARPHRGHRARGRAGRRPGCCFPAIGPTTSQPDGSPRRGSGCRVSAPRAGSTRARASRRSSGSRCSRPWRRDSSSSHPTAAARQRTSSTASPGCSPRRGMRPDSARRSTRPFRRSRPATTMPGPIGRGRWCADRFTIQRDVGGPRRGVPRRRARRGRPPRAGRRRPMTLLVISPDYASHLLPLATLATAWRDRGERVVVAGGPATAGLVAGFGFERARPPARSGLESRRHHDRAAARRRGRLAARILRGDPPRRACRRCATRRRSGCTDLMWRPVEAARATPAHRRRRLRPTRSSSTTSRSARASASPPPGSRTATSSWDIRRRSRSVPRCTGTRRRGRTPSGPVPTSSRSSSDSAAGSRRASPRNGTAPRWSCGPMPCRAPTRSPSTARWCSTTTPRSSPTSSVASLLPPHRFLGSTRARRARGPRGRGLARHGGPVRLRELRELPLGARRRAPAGGRRAPHARRPGGDRDRVDGCRRARRTARRLAGARLRAPGAVCSARPPPP